MNHNLSQNWFSTIYKNSALVEQLKKIKLIIADIDGSLTDGTVECGADFEGTRYFSTQDGYGIKQAMQNGIAVAFVSGKGSGSGLHRARILSIPEHLCILGSEDKRIVVQEIRLRENLSPNEILIYGDDILDANVKLAMPESLFISPENSPFYIQAISDFTLPLTGGNHAFRLLLDLLLYTQKKHPFQNIISQLIK